MLGLKLKGANGLFTPPSYSHVYTLKTIAESNNLGEWFGWDITRVGPVEDETYQELVSHANSGGPVTYGENGQAEVFAHRVGEILALIAGTKEYQFG